MQAYTQLGDLDMAKRHYGEALRHEPDHAAGKAAFSAAKKLASLKSKVSALPHPLTEDQASFALHFLKFCP